MFDTHRLNEKGIEAMSRFKTRMSIAASQCLTEMPDGRDKALFRTKLEEAMFFGAKAISESEENHSEIVRYPEVQQD